MFADLSTGICRGAAKTSRFLAAFAAFSRRSKPWNVGHLVVTPGTRRKNPDNPQTFPNFKRDLIRYSNSGGSVSRIPKKTVISMRQICVTMVLGMMSSSLIGNAVASVPWLSDVHQAQQIAQQQQRLILLHFYADWCRPCVRLERDVYPRPEIVSAISQNYVPVKIDVQRSPELARHYGVQSFPTDVFLEPAGRVVHRTTTPSDPGQYLDLLNQLAAARHQGPPYVDPTARANPLPYAEQNHSQYTNFRDQLPADPSDQPGADRQRWQPLTDPPGQSGAVPPEQEFRIALDGFCAVSLTVRETWQQGDPRWGAYHRGRTYLFASPDFRQQFMADPDRYSPVLAGYDPTRFIDHGDPVEGQRQHGMWFRGRMYLFAEEASLERFQRSPDYYAQRSHEIMMRGRR
jgi:thioredoxin-related protein/YHS domain-containing protein